MRCFYKFLLIFLSLIYCVSFAAGQDVVDPGVSISVPTGVQNGAFDVVITFTEVVSDFEQADLMLSGTATASITAWSSTDNTVFAVLESLDPEVLAVQLSMLRSKSDGSLKYQRAIALLESMLAALRPVETLLLPLLNLTSNVFSVVSWFSTIYTAPLQEVIESNGKVAKV